MQFWSKRLWVGGWFCGYGESQGKRPVEKKKRKGRLRAAWSPAGVDGGACLSRNLTRGHVEASRHFGCKGGQTDQSERV